jgi:hypothetical protein
LIILSIVGVTLYVAAASSGFFLKKYLVEHSEEWTGRKIAIGSILINPFKFAISINDFKGFEAKSDSIFISFDELYINAVLFPLFSKKFVIEEVLLEEPHVRILMKGESFNFDDLVNRFSSGQSDRKPSSGDSYPYRVEKIKLTNGDIDVFNSTFQGGIQLRKINASLPEVASNNPEIRGKLNWNVATGGLFNSSFNIHLDSLNYDVKIKGDSLDIGFLLPFLDKVMYLSDVQGRLDADLMLGGRFDTPVSEAQGFLRLGDFQLMDTLRKPSARLDRFEIKFDTVSAVKGDYVIQHVVIDNPYLRFDLTPNGNSLMQAFPSYDSSGLPVAPDTIGMQQDVVKDEYVNFFTLLHNYFIDLGQAYAINYYAIDSLQITSGDFEFGDYTLDKQFSFLFEDLNLQARKLYSDQDSIKIDMQSKLNHSGDLNANLVLLPKDTGDLKLAYTINNLKVTDFSPYSEYYVAHPFWDGIVFFTSNSTVTNSQLDSKNHILIKHLEVGDKVINKTAYNLPLKLAASLLKDVHGEINFNIPVKGNVNDPSFRFFPIVLKVMKDLIVKAAAAPYKLLVRTFNADEDDLRDVKYDYLQADIEKRQKKALNTLARVLNQKKELRAELVHLSNPDWEKNQYALFEVKRLYYMETKNKDVLTLEDSVAIDQIQRLDTAFVSYIKMKSGAEVGSDVESVCVQLVGEDKISQLLADMNEKRTVLLMEYLTEKVDEPYKFTVVEGSAKDKSQYRERPKFLIRFEAASDSLSREGNIVSRKKSVDSF